ncbi:MAG: hypothetical protein AAF081_17000 [Actinomycetota bacterium]
MAAARLVAVVLAALGALLLLAGPAGAQYGGGGINLFVDSRVPIDETFSVAGQNCPAGSTVEITIDGVAGVLATTTASASGAFSIADIELPGGLTAGTTYTVRSTCGVSAATALMTLVCHDGADPVDGSCEDGSDGIVGGVGPTTTTTTTPISGGGDGNTTTTTPGGGGDTTGGSGGDGSSSSGSNPGGSGGDDLAFTGASFSELLVQIGVSLFALGFVLVILARRRPVDPYA